MYYYAEKGLRNNIPIQSGGYEIATAVLYGLSFLAALAVTVLTFTKLRCGSLGHGLQTWLRLACIFLTFSCMLGTCASALLPFIDLEGRIIEPAQYTHITAEWFHQVTQGLMIIAIVTFCAASPTKAGNKVCLVVAYVLGSVLNGLATTIFVLDIHLIRTRQAHVISHRSTLTHFKVAFDCIIVAAALFALFVSFKGMCINGKPAKIAALASLLLILSVPYQLLVHTSWEGDQRGVSLPNRSLILGGILNTWALLGAVTLVSVAGKKWAEGVASK